MRIPISEIREKIKEAFIRRNFPEDAAQILVEEFLEGELQGRQSHGLMALPSFLENVGSFDKTKYKILTKKHALIVVDAGEISGSYVGRVVADDLIKIAADEGVAVGLIKNMKTWLRPGAIAQYVADHDMVAFVINNGGKAMVAPAGGYDPVVGTNPIGIGVPTDEQPIIIDMATSKHAWGEVRKAKKNNTELPKDSYYTNKGEFAVRPDDAYSALPAGDYKGFSLALFIEIMTGSFLGRDMGKNLGNNLKTIENSDAQSVTRGAMILVMNPAITTNVDQFKKSNSELIREIKKGNKLPGVEEIYIPGERAAQERKENMQNGYLEVDEELWRKITE